VPTRPDVSNAAFDGRVNVGRACRDPIESAVGPQQDSAGRNVRENQFMLFESTTILGGR
jgi:hypothetical protein